MGGTIEPEAHQDVRRAHVGLACLLGIVGVVHRGNSRPRSDQAVPECRQGCGQPPGLADGDMAPDQGRRGPAELFARPHVGHELGPTMTRLHPHQLAGGQRTENPVNRYADVSLKLAQPGRGVVTENPVNPTDVEAERPEALLKLSHVIASKHGVSAKQAPVAQAEARLYQGAPGLGATDPIDPQTPAILERLDGGAGGWSEVRGTILVRCEPEHPEARPQVADCVSGLTLGQGEDLTHPYKYWEIS